MDLLERARRLRGARTPFVLATVVRAQRPTSAKAGDRAIVLPDGTLDGFVGGSCAESTVRLEGLRLLRTGESALLRITPDPLGASAGPAPPDAPCAPGAPSAPGAPGALGAPSAPGAPAAALGASGAAAGAESAGAAAGAESAGEGLVTVTNPCLSGGTLEIFLEAVVPPPLVHVLGDAPVARALGALGAALGYEVRTTTDPGTPIPPDTGAVVVASHGRDEPPVLSAALRAGVPYVALVASRRRGRAVLAGLDVSDEDRSRVRAPAGLDIGARTAGEVALSILAEIVAARPRPAAAPAASARTTTEPAAPGPPAACGVTASGAVSPAVAVDPVCGMSVPAVPTSLHLTHARRTWYFCGTGCREAATAAPERYLAS